MNKNVKDIWSMAVSVVNTELKTYNKAASSTSRPPFDYQKRLIEVFSDYLIKATIDQMETCMGGSKEAEPYKNIWEKNLGTFQSWNSGIKVARNKVKKHFGIRNIKS